MIPRPHPTRLLVLVAALAVSLAVVAAWEPRLLSSVLVVDALVLLVAAVDLALVLWLSRRLQVQFCCPAVWSLARPERLTIALRWEGPLALRLRMTPDLPPSMRVDGAPCSLRIPRRSRCEQEVSVHPQERGRFTVAGIHLALRSWLGLWDVHLVRGRAHALLAADGSQSLRVYPNLRRAAEYALLARTNRLGLIGVRSAAGSGDLEFERLRPFLSGDPLARIDWKATARLDRPVVREFRTERNQNLVILVDCGRMLGGRLQQHQDGTRLLDRSIEAALLLAHVALSQGDRVGVIAYDAHPRRTVPLAGGRRQFHHIISSLHDLEAEPVESRHDLAFLHLRHHVRQRSLVVLVSALLDAVNAQMIERHLESLVGRHLPLAVFLRQPDIFEPLRQPPANNGQLLRAGVAAHIAHWRHEVLRGLEQRGVLTLDCDLDDLEGGLVSRYLDVKARRLL